MRIVTATIAAMIAASGLVIHAQRQAPVDCGLYFAIKGGKVTSVVETTRIECQFEGRFIALVQNFDNTDYTLTLDQFRYNGTNSTTAAACSKTNPQVNHPLPNGGNAGKRFRYHVRANEIGAMAPRKFKTKTFKTECYKFNILLEDDNGNEAPVIDPELEVTEPPPPPPIKGFDVFAALR